MGPRGRRIAEVGSHLVFSFMARPDLVVTGAEDDDEARSDETGSGTLFLLSLDLPLVFLNDPEAEVEAMKVELVEEEDKEEV